jgi:hypothetical protein
MVVATIAWAAVLSRRWRLSDRKVSLWEGLFWLSLTLAFEFGLGAARGVPLRVMLVEYDVADGNLWPLVPLTTAVAPVAMRRR